MDGVATSDPVADGLHETAHEISPINADQRVVARGKFFKAGDRKFFVRGVTYGPFRPEDDGCEYHTPQIVRRDFMQMAASGFNVVRVYTVPPTWLLDEAARCGLRVMVGLAWEQHITFLDTPKQREAIIAKVRDGVKSCAGHPALFAFAVGNEIPPSIVRWYGPKKIERFIKRLYQTVKEQTPDVLVTYVSYPTTEYLRLPFLDFICFNVYLESQAKLARYLARLQNLSHDKPLVMAEIGLDSQRNSEDTQARTLDWQLRTTFAAGCAGAFVFSWTDEWFRGGCEIEDWQFGLTSRDRVPKPALATVRNVMRELPFGERNDWPRISVVVCTYNGGRTIERTLKCLETLEYPNYEVIVVNDGSKDNTEEIAGRYNVRLISIPNGGLSNARNIGMRESKGEIVAYIDDDAFPDQHWLHYLAYAFMTSDHVGIGGPNLSPWFDSWVPTCISHAPGGANHVLVSDHIAEHIPGCNMAFRKSALEAIDGFDTQFRIAGDDVDLCWRLQENGGTLGFHAGAMVWHHRRDTVRGYLRQQRNYGVAEAMLETKWPEKYNQFGHVTWGGRIYGSGQTLPMAVRRWRIYHGIWGSNLFQSIYSSVEGVFPSLPLMPEWYLLIVALTLAAIPGVLWTPSLLAIPLLLVALALPLLQAMFSAGNATVTSGAPTRAKRVRMRVFIGILHLLQPIVRLIGRLSFGLTPWRRRSKVRYMRPRPRQIKIWSEQWVDPMQRLQWLEERMRKSGYRTKSGGVFDRWDLELAGGLFGSVRVLMAVEEHGQGKQMVRMRTTPRITRPALVIALVGLGLSLILTALGGWSAGVTLGIATTFLVIRALGDCAAATTIIIDAAKSQPSASVTIDD